MFKSEIPSRDKWTENSVTYDNEISIFTDGSKDDMGTGSGVFCNHPSIEFTAKLPKECTVFQAEILAIRNAAKLLLETTQERLSNIQRLPCANRFHLM